MEQVRVPLTAIRHAHIRWTKLQVVNILAQYAQAVSQATGLHVSNVRLPLSFVLYDLGRLFVLGEGELRHVLGPRTVDEINLYLADFTDDPRPFPIPLPYDPVADAREYALHWLHMRAQEEKWK